MASNFAEFAERIPEVKEVLYRNKVERKAIAGVVKSISIDNDKTSIRLKIELRWSVWQKMLVTPDGTILTIGGALWWPGDPCCLTLAIDDKSNFKEQKEWSAKLKSEYRCIDLVTPTYDAVLCLDLTGNTLENLTK